MKKRVILVAAFLGIPRIWCIDYSLARLWKGLSQDWVMTIDGTGVHIGFGGVLTLSLFIFGGFIISSIFKRYILPKLFEVFRVAEGAQNTVSRILHYLMIFLAIILGLYAVKLGQLGNWFFIGLVLGISFGAKDLVSDFFAGLWILIERPIELNNFIETGELRGTVKKIAVRATTIRTARNFSVIIPNRELVSKPIINWGAGYYAVGFEFTITLPFSVAPYEMQEFVGKVTSDHNMVLRVPKVSVRLEEFCEYGLLYFVRAFISSRRVRDQWEIASDIRLALLQELKKRGVSIPYPQRVIHHKPSEMFGITKKEYEKMLKEEGNSDK